MNNDVATRRRNAPPSKSSPKPLAYSYIRFSSRKQAAGDSLRRQMEAADAWASKNGLTIAQSYEDLGVSAFRGNNSTQGHLARFIAAVRSNSVPVGSYLIIESLDRLSRAEIPDALAQFLELVRSGIVVVTLMDGKTYTRESIAKDVSDIMISLVIMSRANEESRSKGARVSAAWEKKRQAAIETGEIATKIAPSWLRVTVQGKWEVIKEKAETVREIFRLYAGGTGIQRIVKNFNSTNRPVIGSSNGWHPGFIRRILENRAVLGELVLHRYVNGKRTPIPGIAPLTGYYPQIIDRGLWAQVQALKSANPGKRGRTTDENIFRGLIYTPEGDAVYYVNKGGKKYGSKSRKPKVYLVPSSGWRGIGEYSSWNYDDFRKKFLFLIRTASERPEPQQVEDPRLNTAKNRLAEVDEQIARGIDALLRISSKDLEARLQLLDSEKAALQTKIALLDNERQARKARPTLTLINWNHSEELSKNIRGSVRRIVMDPKAKSFSVELYDGRTYSYKELDGLASIMAPEGELKFR